MTASRPTEIMIYLSILVGHFADLDVVALSVCVALLTTLTLTEGKLLW